MSEDNSQNKRYEIFEKLMIGGLVAFTVVAIIELAGSKDLIGTLLFAFCCLSVSLPFLIFQIACLTLGITQRHKVLLQTSTVLIALMGIFSLLLSIHAIPGTLFAISCICAYNLFVVSSRDSKMSEEKAQADDSSRKDEAEMATNSP
ncbi:MAG: hypothetical protein ACYTFW_05305 [Planctomycetota bacterium]